MESEHPFAHRLPLEDCTSQNVADHYPKEYSASVKQIYNSTGFTRNLEPIDGAISALVEILAAGLDVRVCTAPLFNQPQCQTEKQEWVSKHVGQDWVERLIITRDKSLIAGAV